MAAPKILSVDDSKMIQTLISKGLAAYNAQLFFASNGVEGLAAAARELPELIILDVTMPVMDGIECLTRLKSDPSLRNIPVIMLTAEAGRDNVLKIAKMGVRDYIVKPFSEHALVERVNKVIDLLPKGSELPRTKSVDDPAVVLVIDEHEPIIKSIRDGLASTPWTVFGTSECGSASQMMAKEPPDIILISLSLPNKAALNFYQTIRASFKAKNIPVIGLSVKTASSEQAECKTAGFAGVITKPIDIGELPEKLARMMNLDTSSRYFRTEADVLHIKIPKGLSINGAADLSQYVEPKTRGHVEAGRARLIVNMEDVDRLEIHIIKLILGIVGTCRTLDMKYRLVGSSEFTNQARGYEEMTEFQIFPSVDEAMSGFSVN